MHDTSQLGPDGTFAITVGAGRNRPHGRLEVLAEVPTVEALSRALANGAVEPDGWWSPHLWDGNYRASDRWLGAWGVAADIDYHDADGSHATPSPEVAARFEEMLATLPGNLGHTTPRGGRATIVFDRFVDDAKLFELNALRFGSRLDAALGKVGLAATKRNVRNDGDTLVERWTSGYKVDEAVLADRARMFFRPNARVDGVARVALLQVLSRDLERVADLPQPPTPEVPAPARPKTPSKAISRAAAAYSRDHPQYWPKSDSTCPACGHNGCFGRHPENPDRWVCFSASHAADSKGCGRQGSGCWHGDALDLDARTEALTRVELLVRDGYLAKEAARPSRGNRSESEPIHRWDLTAGQYHVMGWPDPNRPLFVTLEYCRMWRPVHRDNVDLNSASARRRFATAACRAVEYQDSDLRDLVERDLLDIVERLAPDMDAIGAGPEPAGGSIADQLVELAAEAELFHDAEEGTYARIEVDGHKETWPIKSKKFKNWLRRRYYTEFSKVPNNQATQDALGVLEGKAQFDGAEREVHVRVAECDGAIYVDLGRAEWQVVRISATGWDILPDAPVVFRRPKGLLPLPLPERRGSLAELRSFLNLRDDAGWVLFQAWLVAAFRPGRPFPIMVVTGEQGSGKTTAQRIARRVVDPNVAELRSAPRNEHDLVIAAKNGWCLALDNISTIPAWLSDALCRIATGGGFGTRTLYSDDEEELFAGARPTLLNGIEDIATRGDLLDRSILFYLECFDDKLRRPEAKFWEDFDRAHPRIFGGLLDAVSTALRNLPSVKLERSPRMADFTQFAIAAEPALDCEPGAFLQAYYASRESLHENALDASVVAREIRRFAARLTGEWAGPSSELLAALEEQMSPTARRSKAWPKSPGALSGALRRLAPNLRGVGFPVEFTQEPGAGSRKLIRLWPQKSDASDAATQDQPPRVDGVDRVDDLQRESSGEVGPPTDVPSEEDTDFEEGTL